MSLRRRKLKGRKRKLLRDSMEKREIDIDPNIVIDYTNFSIMKTHFKIMRILEESKKEDYIETVNNIIIEASHGNEESSKNYFLKVIGKFLDIKVKNKRSVNVNMCSCGNIIGNEGFIELGNNIMECECCGRTLFTGIDEAKKKTVCFENVKKNMIFSFNAHCGNVTLPFQLDNLLEEIDTYLEENNHMISKRYLEQDVDKDNYGRYNGTCLSKLWRFLVDMGYSSYSKYSMIIAHSYWGWDYPRISNKRDIFFRYYDIIQAKYYEIPEEIKQRSSNLPMQYMLFKILELCGVDCVKEDFKMSRKEETLIKLDNIWRIICEDLEHEDIYFYPTIN